MTGSVFVVSVGLDVRTADLASVHELGGWRDQGSVTESVNVIVPVAPSYRPNPPVMVRSTCEMNSPG
jgi:hypothetical protein